MNKELEALNRLKTFCLSETGMPYKMYSSSAPVIEEDASIVEQALKRNEPMKVDMMEFELCSGELLFRCPNCRRTWRLHYGDTFCKDCGQRLDWSDEK